MKPNFFINCTSIEDVKQLYKKLAMLHHPDKGGDTLTMQQINAEYQQILKDKSFSFDNEEQEKDFIIYPEVISKLIILDQVLIEPVSYTHLRAHETRHDLVCRLLLEKKKKKNIN